MGKWMGIYPILDQIATQRTQLLKPIELDLDRKGGSRNGPNDGHLM
jgi:hypothetical protein